MSRQVICIFLAATALCGQVRLYQSYPMDGYPSFDRMPEKAWNPGGASNWLKSDAQHKDVSQWDGVGSSESWESDNDLDEQFLNAEGHYLPEPHNYDQSFANFDFQNEVDGEDSSPDNDNQSKPDDYDNNYYSQTDSRLYGSVNNYGIEIESPQSGSSEENKPSSKKLLPQTFRVNSYFGSDIDFDQSSEEINAVPMLESERNVLNVFSSGLGDSNAFVIDSGSGNGNDNGESDQDELRRVQTDMQNWMIN